MKIEGRNICVTTNNGLYEVWVTLNGTLARSYHHTFKAALDYARHWAVKYSCRYYVEKSAIDLNRGVA